MYPHPRKARLIEAAVTCILRDGYHRTGVRDIATEAGVSLGNLYNHFEGKEAVLVEIAQLEGRELDPFVRRLGAPGDARDILDRFVVEYADYASEAETALLAIELVGEALRNPNIAQIFSDNRGRLLGALERLLVRGQQSGQFSAQFKPSESARLLLDVIDGHAVRAQWPAGVSSCDAKELQAFVLRAVKA